MDIRTKLIFALVAVSLGSMLLLGLVVSIGVEGFVTNGALEQPEFRAWLVKTALILAAFAILVGLGLGLRFALPIHDLAEVANRIRKGEMDARASVAREDEVGLLARTFNEMAGEIESQMSLLREFRKFFDVSIDLMCIAGTDGYFKRTNPAFVRTLGWTEEELLERPYYDFIHPDDVEKTEEEVAKLAEGIPTISFENRLVSKDGRYVLLRWTAYPDDGVLYSIAHVIDESPAA
jgi:PAS domain S-box-containing protein